MNDNEMYYSQLIDEKEPVSNHISEEEKKFIKEEEAKINNSKHRRKLSPRDITIICVLGIVITIAVVAAVSLYKRALRYTLTGDAYQSYMVEKHLPSGTVLSVDNNGEVVSDFKSYGKVMSSIPVYYVDKTKFVIPSDLVLYSPSSGLSKKADIFTEFYMDVNSNVFAVLNNETKPIQGGFLYDGKDLYIFLVPVVLEYNGKILELPAFSYVEAVYQDDALIYNYLTNECIIEPLSTDLIAYSSVDYSVNMIQDAVTMSDGQRILIFTRPDLLDSMFK